MTPPSIYLPAALLALVSCLAIASDPSPLQDFCVAEGNSSVFVNGLVCKNPSLATANDFFMSGLDKPGSTTNALGSSATAATVSQIPGLNTLGLTLVRVDYAPNGTIPPHSHPRASEILTVLEGTLYAGFIATDNKLFAKVLNKGDAFVFPQGLIHFQFNVGNTDAVSISAPNSQNAGVVIIANAVFGSNPPISDYVLAKAFQVDKKLVDSLQAKF